MTDLVEYAWGWERLVPYDRGIDTPTYVAYLQQYYKKNSLEYVVTGDQKPEECPLKNDCARGKIANGNGLAGVANNVSNLPASFSTTKTINLI
jgi:hypothetical protein